MPRLVVTQRLFDESLEPTQGTGIDVDYRDDDRPPDPEELKASLSGADGVVCLLTDRIDSEMLAWADRLRVVANVAVGYDNIDVDAATRTGVVVTNTPGVLTDATADLAFALLLAAARRVPEGDRYLREGRYERWVVRQPQLGVDVAGRTLGVYGFGAIGRAVARRARGFGMPVLYHSRSRAPEHEEAALGARPVGFPELLARSDFVSIHAPLTDDTRHAFDADAFAAMRPSAILVNTARGPIVDEAALADALRRGDIAGAGIDVYEEEPRVHPDLLARQERVVLVPHLGSATDTTRRRMAHMAVSSAVDVLRGRRPENVVNPEAL